MYKEREKMKKKFTVITSCLLAFFLSIGIISAASSNFTKKVSGTFYQNTMKYSFTAVANISYNNSGNITSISNLAFTSKTCDNNMGYGPSCIIVPTQKSKSYSGRTATYVVALKRTAAGVYTETVDVTIKYTVNTRANNSISLFNSDSAYEVDISISEGEAYNIEYLSTETK